MELGLGAKGLGLRTSGFSELGLKNCGFSELSLGKSGVSWWVGVYGDLGLKKKRGEEVGNHGVVFCWSWSYGNL